MADMSISEKIQVSDRKTLRDLTYGNLRTQN
jgi:hypothetical protein